MGVVVRTCCCGCDLRVGVLLIGIFYLLLLGYGMYSNINSSIILNDIHNSELFTERPKLQHNLKVAINLSYAGIAFAVISVLTNVSLLLSAWGKNRYLAYPWVIWGIFSLIYSIGVTIYIWVTWSEFFQRPSVYDLIGFIVTIFGWLLLIYFIVVVYSYTENLRQDPSAFEPRLPLNIMTQSPPYERVHNSPSYERVDESPPNERVDENFDNLP